MKNLPCHALLACASVLAAPVYAADADAPAPTLVEALTAGKTALSFRLRHELVDDQAQSQDANATTLRTRLTYSSAAWHRLSAGLEFDYVAALGSDRFNDTRNGQTAFPVVADPDGADLNQAFLRYEQQGNSVTVGRQRINMANQRFVGGVGWRQNEQTFDAIRGQFTPYKDMRIDYSYIDNTQRIFGPEQGKPAPKLDSDHHVAVWSWAVRPELSASAYGYWLNFPDAAALSSRTLGMALTGEIKRRDVALDYRVEAARQQDYANSPVAFSADYHHLVLGARVAGVRLGVGEELLGADASAGVAVQTPLATMHAFQGWADKFLSTPKQGVKDQYIDLSTSLSGVALKAVWHDFSADTGGADYGQEWNVQASKTLMQRYTLTAKYANYRADTLARDTQKVWLMAEAKF
ncbi:MAG: alginate export family protein [Paraperlucidibaca sp.]